MTFDFSAVAVPFRMHPGLRRLPPGVAQLTPNARDDEWLRAKLTVLSGCADEALLAEPGFDASAALQAVVAQATAEHPDAFSVDAHGACTAHRLGWTVSGDRVSGDGEARVGDCLRALPPPWRLAGLLCLAFAEDFAVIDASGRIPWLAVCLPSSWRPAEKVGRHFADVHAPVADNAGLLAAAPHLARLVTAGERWERFVWTVSSDGLLDHHPRRRPAGRWSALLGADDLGAGAFLRSERQTFIPVPGRQQAVFTIRVQAEPLNTAVTRAGDAERLHAAIASMSPAVIAYRGLVPVREQLLAWLDRRRQR